jgi:hypothetical protein
LRRRYDKAEVKNDGQTRELPYHGKNLLIEKKDSKYRFLIEDGKEVTGKDAEHLDREFNRERDTQLEFNRLILPKKAVRVKESWAIGVAALAKDLEKLTYLEMDPGKSSARGKLVRVYRKGGRLFGVLEMNMVIAGKAIKMGDVRIDLKPPCKLNLKVTLDVCIDGSRNLGVVEAKTDLSLEATLPVGNPGTKVSMTLQGSFRETHQEVKKK